MLDERDAVVVVPSGWRARWKWEKRRSCLVRAARIIGYLFAVGLVAWVVPQAAKGVRFDEEDFLPFIGSLVPAVASWLFLGRAWAALVGAPKATPAISTWTRSQALRYLPGALWAPAARAASVKGAFLTKASIVVVEAALTLAVGAGVGGVFMATGGNPYWAFLVLVPIAMCASAALLIGRVDVPTRRLIEAAAWNFASWITYGASAWMTQLAIGPTRHPLAIVGAACLARAAGMAAIFDPGGVGVREVAYVALLTSFLPQDKAAAGAIGSRLILTVAELGVLLVVGVLWKRRNDAPSPAESGNRAAPVALAD